MTSAAEEETAFPSAEVARAPEVGGSESGLDLPGHPEPGECPECPLWNVWECPEFPLWSVCLW